MYIVISSLTSSQLKQDKTSEQEHLEGRKQEAPSSLLKTELVSILMPGENAWQAMRRLGSKREYFLRS
jgi:hypothetical protein